MQQNPQHADSSQYLPALLPNPCDNRVLLLLILIAELLAVVLTLSQQYPAPTLWAYLGATSLFIQSVALIDAALLCYTRRWLLLLKPVPLGITVYLGLQLVTASMTVVYYFFVMTPGFNGVALWNQLGRNIGVSAIISAVLMRFFYLQHQNKQREQAENNAKIQVLQARIRPHFLFNSLNTIASLVHAQPQQAEEAILDLAELFRATLAHREKITLAEEMALVEKYLHIESLRLGPRLRVETGIARELLTLELPPLVLQPLVENAVYHGIETLADGGTILIQGEKTGTGVNILIRNPRSIQPQNNRSQGNRIALDNIRQRLLLHYGRQAALSIEQTETEFAVELHLPDGLK